MTVQVELSFDELTEAVKNYAKAHGANIPDGSKVVFQCYGPDVQSVGGIKTILAKIVIAEQDLPEPAPATPPVTPAA